MMTRLSCDVLNALNGRTLATAESCTGGGIGAALTAIPGSSKTYKGGIVCYTNWVKEQVLGVPGEMLEEYGAVSSQVAQAMAQCIKERLKTDVAVSVTGLAGPEGDDRGNPVGTVFIGFESENITVVKQFRFSGDRDDVRRQAVVEALKLILENA